MGDRGREGQEKARRRDYDTERIIIQYTGQRNIHGGRDTPLFFSGEICIKKGNKETNTTSYDKETHAQLT